MKIRTYYLCVVCYLCFFGSSGCSGKKFPERIEQSFQQVEESRKAFSTENTKAAEWLSWHQAVHLLKKRNISYLRAQDQLRQIESERKNFAWRQLDPRLRAVASLGAALNQLSALDESSYGVRILGSINVPNPVSYYASRYALELQYYQSQLDFELSERRLIALLYTSFVQQQQLERDRLSLSLASRQRGGDLSEKIAYRERSKEKEKALRRRAEQQRLALNRLLDTPSRHWVALTTSMPDISYADKLEDLDPKKGYGKLALRQAAGQVEASLLRVLRVKISRWPIVSTGISLPTLYNSREEREFDLGDSTLFASLGKGFEFTGREARAAKDAEFHATLIQRSLRQRLEVESSRLAQLKLNYQTMLDTRARLEEETRWLEKNPPAGSSSTMVAHLEEISSNRDELNELSMRLRLFDLQFWIWDESYWKRIQ